MHLKKIFLFLLVALSSVSMFADNTFTQNRTDFRDESIYFMITTRFYDGDPANNVLCWDNPQCQKSTGDPCWRGDFAGVIEKLDYIKALGFTAIWITPIVQNASGYDYHGYHAMDFSKVDIRYESHKGKGKYGGSEKDVTFQSLIDAAHAKGIKIILDIVLNHTGNFGEQNLCHLFDRSQNILNQADINKCMLPDYTKLPSNYPDNENTQYQNRLKWMKNTDGQNHDTKNYWHHVATSWNWDLPNRWWGQIAGDCVDLNTENPEVDDYLIKCYGEFIKMGVDNADGKGRYTITYNNPEGWSSVNCYVWDAGDGNKEYFGSWPGTAMTKVGNVWTITLEVDKKLINGGIIFNTNGSPQTKDLVLNDYSVFTLDGTPTSQSAVHTAPTSPAVLYTLQGIRVERPAKGGIYISNGRKVVMK